MPVQWKIGGRKIQEFRFCNSRTPVTPEFLPFALIQRSKCQRCIMTAETKRIV